MLNYKNTLTVFSIAIAGIAVTDVFKPVSAWLYIGIVLAVISLFTWGSIRIQADFYLRSVCSGDRNIRAVSLTFDDGPDGLVTPMVLDILKENKVKAAFFVIGSKAEKHPEILERIEREGHIIGGHSYSHHFFFDLFSSRRMKQEMKHTAEVIFNITGKNIRLFRPPYGVTNPTVARVVKDLKLTSVGWSLRSKDTMIKDDNVLLKRIQTSLKPGDVLLMHDSKAWTVNRLKALIKHLRDQRYTMAEIDQLLNIEPYVR